MATRQVFSDTLRALADPDNLEAGPGYTPGLVVPQIQANPTAILVATRRPDDPIDVEVWVGIMDTLNEGWHSLFLGEIVASKYRLPGTARVILAGLATSITRSCWCSATLRVAASWRRVENLGEGGYPDSTDWGRCF
jgi:hypothetical protein